MISTIVYVKVKEGTAEAFIEATVKNHEASVKENGNRRFDILQNDEDTNCFVLYEAYDSREDAKAHKTTEHYLTWRETVASMMAEPRKGVGYSAVRPL